MPSTILVEARNETATPRQSTRRQPTECARCAEQRLALERLALMSEERSRLSPRTELDVLALTGSGAGTDRSDWRM